jgi:hypothetical protein
VAVRRTAERAGATVEETHTYSRIGALKGLGNAIDLRPAAAFIGACMEILVPMLTWLFLAMLLAVASIQQGIG